MMSVHRALCLCVALVAAVPAASHGQAKLEEQKPEKLNRNEMAQFKALTGLVEAVVAGKEPAPADVTVAVQNHFIRSATNIFVPYVLEIGGGKFTSFPVALYVRAIPKGNPAAAPVFSDIFFANANSFISTGPDTVQLTRAMELPPGDVDVTFALSEAPSRNTRTPAKRVVSTHSISVPDLAKELTTSSIILAKNLEDAPQQLTPRQQMEQPFTIGGQRITPTFTAAFTKADELLFVFLVYNVGATPEGKPDLDVGYTVARGQEDKPFAKMPTTSFNATTLPAEFNLTAGHQVMVAQGVPLSTFAPGEYKIGMTITDKTKNQTITRTIPFTVNP